MDRIVRVLEQKGLNHHVLKVDEFESGLKAPLKEKSKITSIVILAKVGMNTFGNFWIPAFTGMTK